jgi:hypothetical protein
MNLGGPREEMKRVKPFRPFRKQSKLLDELTVTQPTVLPLCSFEAMPDSGRTAHDEQRTVGVEDFISTA